MAQSLSEHSIPPAAKSLSFDIAFQRAQQFYEQGYFDAAHRLTLDLLKLDPGHADALVLLANALREMGRFDDALKVLARTLELHPGYVHARASAALTFFYKEDWARAWQAFEVRMQLMNPPPRVTLPGPDGKPVALQPWRFGPAPESLLVLGEQGLGDTIQFARFFPLLEKRGIRAVCVVQKRLLGLLKSLNANVEYRVSEEAGSVTGIKGWTPLMQLPQALGILADEFPKTVPYLRAEPERIARWREKMGTHGFRIGIVWQGNPDKRIDQGRSAPLESFAPLAQIPNARLISLQTGPPVAAAARVPFKVETLGDEFDAGPDGFLDSAAVMMNLDLIVTVDTSLAHLAGALGRPVFILLKHPGADWRWLYKREDSVWYPSARLFRQKTWGEWGELLQRAANVAWQMSQPASPTAPVSVGELFDKLGILEIKRERIKDPHKLANVEREHKALAEICARAEWHGADIQKNVMQLKQVNELLWDVEDKLREHERTSFFDAKFTELARSVYKLNDRRAKLKLEINRLCGSALVEEKSYAAY